MTKPQKTQDVFMVKEHSGLEAVARQILSVGPRVILLRGELGSGKTTLVKALCHILGSVNEVTSPTFTLINEYRDAEDHAIFHIDLYRLETLEDAMQIGLEEYILSGTWCFIEWPEILLPTLRGDFVQVTLEVLPDGSRRICILK